MKYIKIFIMLMAMAPLSAVAQVTPQDINGTRKVPGSKADPDTNVSFSLRMTLAGEETLVDSAVVGDEVSIFTTIRPEAEDIGKSADLMIVNYLAPNFTMLDLDGNFVLWNGVLTSLVPFAEDVTLTEELDLEFFSGTLGATGRHRFFVGYLVDDTLYFTPTALKVDIVETEQSAEELAIELFNSTISPNIVQASCIGCHVSGGSAQGQAIHTFVRTFNSDHLEVNYQQFKNLHASRGSDLILNKVSGLVIHGGGTQYSQGSSQYNSLQEFLDLLDQASQ